MSAVSNRVMPRSIALWITLREVSRSVRWPKLLQPRPTAETRRPEPPRLRICMDRSCGGEGRERAGIVTCVPKARKAQPRAPGGAHYAFLTGILTEHSRRIFLADSPGSYLQARKRKK